MLCTKSDWLWFWKIDNVKKNTKKKPKKNPQNPEWDESMVELCTQAVDMINRLDCKITLWAQ